MIELSFFLFFSLLHFIHPNSIFLFGCQLICPLLLHHLVLVHLTLCASHLFSLQPPFNSICTQIHSYRHSCNSCTHSMPYHCCHAMPILLSSFLFSVFATFSLLSVGIVASSTFVVANLFFELSVAFATGFSRIERSHRRSHACIRLFPLSIPRIALLRSCFGTPPAPPPFYCL